MNTPTPRQRSIGPFLALGCAFLPIGIATKQPAFLIIGLAFLAFDIAQTVRKPKP